MNTRIDYADFERVDVRVGRILTARPFEKARRPAYQLTIDFGTEIGVRTSSAQLTDLYTPETLVGRLVVAVVNFPPKQIANFISEVLVLGVPNEQGHIALLVPDSSAPLGARMF